MSTVVQISDSHLRADDPVSDPGWRAAQRIIREIAPTLIIHTGDIVRDDPADQQDHVYAARALNELGSEVLALPGNHDVGDGPPTAAMPDPTLLDRFCATYGGNHWERQVGDWHLIGVNSMLFGTGCAVEPGHWQWFADTLSARRGANLAVFMHKPPFLISPDESGDVSATLPQPARQRFWDLIRAHGVRLVACGHRHEYRALNRDGVLVVWAPTTSGLLDEASPPLSPRAFPGLVEYLFAGPTLHHRVIPFIG